MGILQGTYDGIRTRGPVTNLAAAAVANAAVIFQISNFTQLQGTRSAVIKRLLFWNNAAGNTTLSIGTGAGAGFAAALVPLVTLNGLNGVFDEDDLPQEEFFADITAFPLALAGGSSIDIQVEVAERG